MHRFIIVALAALAVASCDRFPDNGLQIGGMLPLEEDCSIDPAVEERRSRGVWDVSPPVSGGPSSTGQYTITPLLESYLISRSTDIQAEQNNLQIEKYEIRLETPDGVKLDLGDLPNPYTRSTSAVLPAAVDDDFTIGTASAVAVPREYREPAREAVSSAGFNELIIVIKAIGTTMGGFTQKSGGFFWPVTLCEGCRDLCPTPGSGEDLTDEQKLALEDSCLPGQDSYYYCTFPPPPEDDMTP
jgi:hypothetical protein